MDERASQTEEYAKQAILASAAVSLAVAELLIEKGIITAEEFEQRRLAMVANLDQTLARVHDRNDESGSGESDKAAGQ